MAQSSVLVIGAGGLGCPVIQYLAAVGVGSIGIVDYDTIELSNLNRQILYGISDIGKSKVDVAKLKISTQYNDIKVDSFPIKVDSATIEQIAKKYSYVMDCTDNLETRYIISDYCKREQKTLILGAVFEYEGQVFRFSNFSGNYYRDVFPRKPSLTEIPPCSINGILGVLTGIIGNLMVSELIKVIVSDKKYNILLSYNLNNNNLIEIEL